GCTAPVGADPPDVASLARGAVPRDDERAAVPRPRARAARVGQDAALAAPVAAHRDERPATAREYDARSVARPHAATTAAAQRSGLTGTRVDEHDPGPVVDCDLLLVRRPRDGQGVLHARERARRSAADVENPQQVVVPEREGDLAAVGRPGKVEDV